MSTATLPRQDVRSTFETLDKFPAGVKELANVVAGAYTKSFFDRMFGYTNFYALYLDHIYEFRLGLKNPHVPPRRNESTRGRLQRESLIRLGALGHPSWARELKACECSNDVESIRQALRYIRLARGLWSR